MTNYFENAFNVRRNEFTPASLLFVYLFLIIGCYMMGTQVGKALFLKAYPNSLPHAMIATAVVVGVFASVYIRLSRRIRMESLMIGSLLFFASSFALFWWLTRSFELHSPSQIYVSTFNGNQVLRVDPNVGVTSVLNLDTTKHPADIVVGPDGKIYICDVEENDIRRIDPKTLVVETVYDQVECEFCPSGPIGPSFNTLGDLYFNTGGPLATHSGIWKISSSQLSSLPTTAVRVVTAAQTGSTSGGGTTFDATDKLLFVDRSGGNVWRFNPSTSTLTPRPIISSLMTPLGIAVDRAGEIFVSDQGVNSVKHYDTKGTFLGLFVTFTSPDTPSYLRFGASGNLFVVTSRARDASGGKVWRVDPSGTKRQLAGAGTANTFNLPNNCALGLGLPATPGKWVYLLIYIWVYMTGAMGPTMGWTLANVALTTREARRIFGFIGAGAVLGAPCAGFITADALRPHGHMRPETLLLVMVLCLVSCATLVHFLFQSTRHRRAGVNLAVSADRDVPRNLRQTWAYIQNSRYLYLITVLIAVGCTATAILTYQFTMIAKAHYGADTAGLAAFFGRFDGYAGLAAFLLQMLLTGRLLRWFGIRVTLFVLPAVFIAASLGVLAAPMLLTACILKGSHSLLRYSLDKSSTELLYLPVAPPEIKNQIKSFIDGFIWRMADGVAGAALLLFATGLKVSPGRISLVNLVFLVAWLGIAYEVRGEYLKVLRRAIERRTLDPERTAAGILDSTTMEVLGHALERGGEQQVLYGLSLFEVGRETGWHPALRGLLEHASPAVRRQALRLLADGGDREILPQVERMVGDENLDVRTEALRYLVLHTGRDPLTLLTAGYDFPTYALQGAVVVYLVRSGRPDFSAPAGLILHEMLAWTGPDAARSRAEAARVLGMIPPPFALHSELLKLLRDEDPEVAEQALLSAGKIQGREILPLVIEKLGEPRLMAAARAALVQYGDRALGTLQDYLEDLSIPLPIRKQIPRVLARIPLPESATALTNCLVQSDPGLRFDILKALNKLRRLNPDLVPTHQLFADLLEAELMGYYRSFQVLAALDPVASTAQHPLGSEPLLTCALRERMQYEFERLFRLLALLYSPQDIHNAYVGLASGRAQLRANALEVLEQSLRPDLYQRLHYALDPEITLEERLAFARRLCHTGVDSRAEALRILIRSADRWLCACALYAVGEQCLTELSGEVRQMRCEADPLLAETWQWTCRRLDASLAA